MNNSEIADSLGWDEGTVRNDLRALSEDSESVSLDEAVTSETSESIEDRYPELAGLPEDRREVLAASLGVDERTVRRDSANAEPEEESGTLPTSDSANAEDPWASTSP